MVSVRIAHVVNVHDVFIVSHVSSWRRKISQFVQIKKLFDLHPSLSFWKYDVYNYNYNCIIVIINY